MRLQKMTKTIYAIALLAGASLAQADQRLWINDQFGQVGTVDLQTGATVVAGDSGVSLTDIAFDPNGNLYGISFTALYRIDKATGASTRIGFLGVNDANSLVFDSSGTLYAAGESTGNLYVINPVTGQARTLLKPAIVPAEIWHFSMACCTTPMDQIYSLSTWGHSKRNS
jgi:streptogramin lyase